MKEHDKMSDAELARIVLRECRDEYAKAYAKLIPSMTGEALRVQWLYVLSNTQTWRGPVARSVKAAVKRRYNMK